MLILVWRPSLDGHEVLVAQTAREMVQNGDFLHPTFAGQPRWQKPPLGYWQVVGISWVVGEISPFVARVPSMIATVIMTTLVVLLTCRFASPSTARAAGMAHAILPWTLAFGTSAIVDMTLSLLVALCIAVATSETIPTRDRIIVAWSLVGVCILAKGPIGPAVILGALITHWSTTARFHFERRSVHWHVVGLLFALVIAGAWPTLVLTESPAIARVWWEQSIGRFAEHWGEQTRPWYYYLYQVPALVGPVFILTIVGIFRLPNRLLLGWFGFTFLLLSLSEGKRDHYILPALLPCSVWAGLGWEYLTQRLRNRSQIGWIIMATALASLLATAVSLKILPRPSDPMSPLQSIVKRQQETLRQARRIAQIGSNNHATAFILDRPMRWYPNIERWREDGSLGDLVLMVSRDPLDVPATWRLIDQQVAVNGKETFRLFAPIPRRPQETP
jgi:4-amino-4-deoxy-L-arabinose transferase-like glycosyltransferase